jgi:hypothetical protein
MEEEEERVFGGAGEEDVRASRKGDALHSNLIRFKRESRSDESY